MVWEHFGNQLEKMLLFSQKHQYIVKKQGEKMKITNMKNRAYPKNGKTHFSNTRTEMILMIVMSSNEL
jgi:hypothetical protein